MEIPRVSSCEMKECFFNTAQECHAPAINVGGDLPECDTFINESRHGGAMGSTAMVGACKVVNCKFNDEFCCGASDIVVGHHGSRGDCLTYSAR